MGETISNDAGLNGLARFPCQRANARYLYQTPRKGRKRKNSGKGTQRNG
jgi:hypothetical protein